MPRRRPAPDGIASSPGPVNIGSEEMVTINELAGMAMAIAGKKLRIRHISPARSGFAANSDNRLIGADSAGSWRCGCRTAQPRPTPGSMPRCSAPRGRCSAGQRDRKCPTRSRALRPPRIRQPGPSGGHPPRPTSRRCGTSRNFRKSAGNAIYNVAEYIAQPLSMLAVAPFLVHKLDYRSTAFGCW